MTSAMESKEEIPRPSLSFVPSAMILCFSLEMPLWPFPVTNHISRSLMLSVLEETEALEIVVQGEEATHGHLLIATTSDSSHSFLEDKYV